jgi:4-amino-4-deoxy-L-arabinose transferase-like glycosyltransferase
MGNPPESAYDSNPQTILGLRLTSLRLDVLSITLLTAIALGCNFYALGVNNVWYDEGWSFGIARQSLPGMWPYLWGSSSNMALYYYILHFWLGLLQALHIPLTEDVLRAPSAVAASLSVLVVFLIGKRFWTRMAAFIGATFFAFGYLLIYSSHQARSYGLQMLLICISWYALLSAINSHEDKSRTRWWIVYVIASGLGVYAHLWSGLILISQVAALLGLSLAPGPWQTNTRRAIRGALISLGAVAALITPIAIDAGLHGGESTWILPATTRDLSDFFYFEFAGGRGQFYMIVAIVALGGVATALYRTGWFGRLRERILPPDGVIARFLRNLLTQPNAGVLALYCWLLVPTLLSFLVTQNYLNLYLFNLRYLAPVTPAFCLLVGIGVSSARFRVVQYALIIIALEIAWLQVPTNYAILTRFPDYQASAQWLNTHSQSGEGLACLDIAPCSVPMDYYLRLAAGPVRFDSDSPGAWNFEANRQAPYDDAALSAYSAKHPYVCLLLPVPPSTSIPMKDWFDTHSDLVMQTDGALTIRCYDTRSTSTTSESSGQLGGAHVNPQTGADTSAYS